MSYRTDHDPGFRLIPIVTAALHRDHRTVTALIHDDPDPHAVATAAAYLAASLIDWLAAEDDENPARYWADIATNATGHAYALEDDAQHGAAR